MWDKNSNLKFYQGWSYSWYFLNQRKWIKKQKNVPLVKVAGLDSNVSITTLKKIESLGEEIQNNKEVTVSQSKEC